MKNIVKILLLGTILFLSVLSYVPARGLYDVGKRGANKFLNYDLKEDNTDARINISYTSFWNIPEYKNTDVEKATSFSQVMQSIINRVNSSNIDGRLVPLDGFDIEKQYYNELNRSLAEGNSPDLFMISSTKLGEYYTGGYLERLYNKDLIDKDIDTHDWTIGAKNQSSVFSHIYGVPLGVDKLVWYVNIELFQEAGLIDEDGNPILPTSYEELVAQAKQMKETTGAPYLGIDLLGLNGTRALLSLLWQYNVEIMQVNKYERPQIGLNTFSARLVATDMQDFFSSDLEYGVIGQSSIKMQQDFVNNKVAVLIDTYSVKNRLFVNFERRFQEERELLIKQAKAIESNDTLEAKKPTIHIPTTKDYAYIYPFPNLYGKDITWGTTNLLVMRNHLRQDNYQKYLIALDIMSEIQSYSDEWTKHGMAPTLYSEQAELYYFQTLNPNDIQTTEQEIEIPKYIKAYDEKLFIKEEIKDIPLSGNYQDMMLILQSMTNDILIKQNNVKTILRNTEADLTDLLIKKGSVIYD